MLVRRGLSPELGDAIFENMHQFYSRDIKVTGTSQPLSKQFIKLSKNNGGLGLSSF